ncbi:MAG: hypothetical protein J2P25_21535 [Nocardiopsaceae bacterium]|nr:hypothetical protein [Nocardiopsaceae bacterium]
MAAVLSLGSRQNGRSRRYVRRRLDPFGIKGFRACRWLRECCILKVMEDLFDFQSLWVMQPGSLPASRARYQIFGGRDRELLASAADVERRGWLPDVVKSIPDSSMLQIVTAEGDPMMVMVMRYTEWLTEFLDSAGALVGTIAMGDSRRQYKILDESGQVVGKVIGDLGLRKFSVSDASGSNFATVRKTRAGLLKEMLTSNDHYKVEFIGPVAPQPLRTLTVMVPIVLDFILYEPV